MSACDVAFQFDVCVLFNALQIRLQKEYDKHISQLTTKAQAEAMAFVCCYADHHILTSAQKPRRDHAAHVQRKHPAAGVARHAQLRGGRAQEGNSAVF